MMSSSDKVGRATAQMRICGGMKAGFGSVQHRPGIRFEEASRFTNDGQEPEDPIPQEKIDNRHSVTQVESVAESHFAVVDRHDEHRECLQINQPHATRVYLEESAPQAGMGPGTM